MRKSSKKQGSSLSISQNVRKKIDLGGERLWRLTDFKDMPITAVAQALSRLSRQGIIQRLGKGLYYRSRQTAFGQSKPSPSLFRALSLQIKDIFPAGIAAANLLGFTTQNPARIEISTSRRSLPRSIIDKETIIHTRRPESWKNLSHKEAAILDFLRQGGKASEYSIEETTNKLIQYIQKEVQFERLIQVAEMEPPRVRAILGAIGEEIECNKSLLDTLKENLNPLSKFDFGNFIALKYAKEWQAKEIRR